MGPIGHTAASLGVGAAAWFITGSPLAIPVALATGVFVDLDHVTDFFDSRDQGRPRHMLRLFHAWEYLLVTLVVVLAFSQHPMLLTALLAYLSHLLLDQFANRVHPMAYFIVYRAAHGFRRSHLSPNKCGESSESLDGSLPLWGRLEPWLWRLVTRFRGGEG